MKQFFVLFIVIALVILAGCAQNQSTENKTTTAKTTQAKQAQQTALGKIDIAALNITTSSPSWKAEDRVTIYPVVRNIGKSMEGVQVGLYVNGKLINMFSFDFKEGETKSPPYAWYPAKAGNYDIKIIVDPNNKINDADDSNNQFETSVTIY